MLLNVTFKNSFRGHSKQQLGKALNIRSLGLTFNQLLELKEILTDYAVY